MQYIYMALFWNYENFLIKIGRTNNPKSRLKSHSKTASSLGYDFFISYVSPLEGTEDYSNFLESQIRYELGKLKAERFKKEYFITKNYNEIVAKFLSIMNDKTVEIYNKSKKTFKLEGVILNNIEYINGEYFDVKL